MKKNLMLTFALVTNSLLVTNALSHNAVAVESLIGKTNVDRFIAQASRLVFSKVLTNGVKLEAPAAEVISKMVSELNSVKGLKSVVKSGNYKLVKIEGANAYNLYHASKVIGRVAADRVSANAAKPSEIEFLEEGSNASYLSMPVSAESAGVKTVSAVKGKNTNAYAASRTKTASELDAYMKDFESKLANTDINKALLPELLRIQKELLVKNNLEFFDGEGLSTCLNNLSPKYEKILTKESSFAAQLIMTSQNLPFDALKMAKLNTITGGKGITAEGNKFLNEIMEKEAATRALADTNKNNKYCWNKNLKKLVLK